MKHIYLEDYYGFLQKEGSPANTLISAHIPTLVLRERKCRLFRASKFVVVVTAVVTNKYT